jgi:hypothetical protein
MITEEKLEVLHSSIEEVRGLLVDIAASKGLDDWIPQRDAEKLTGLSKSSLYNLRQRGDITYSTFTDKKIFYRRSDLIRYLDKREKMRA